MNQQLPTHVLCMDRDYTVNVNPCQHDEHEQVPLRWVKHWAHDDSSVDVWASGNQHLKKEAEIPGIEEARRVWERLNGYDPSDRYESDGYHSYKPARREGLQLIRDCYDQMGESPEFIVVDDVNLMDMADWTYYPSWEFVPEQRDGQTGLSDPSGTSYTDTSAESKACHEDLQRHASVIQ